MVNPEMIVCHNNWIAPKKRPICKLRRRLYRAVYSLTKDSCLLAVRIFCFFQQNTTKADIGGVLMPFLSYDKIKAIVFDFINL
ncbi:MAG: hypothetical protein COA42_01410 [Alteromonadaceae bacterium]|nr:MAG: hypothetical protein COA42_01410 [Alteromonadaceae bacterium]